MRKSLYGVDRLRRYGIGKTAIPETSTLALMVALTLQAAPASGQDAPQAPAQGTSPAAAAQGTTEEVDQGDIELPTVEVVANSTLPSFAWGDNWAPPPPSAGIGQDTDMNEAASAFTVSGQQVNERIFSRPGEALEIVPGLIATQHSGDGKANQWFLRGFNLDHGTDLAIFMDGMPMNMPTHAHGQGYADVNMLIPELIGSINIEKGPYFADVGDFASAGSVHINLIDAVDGPQFKATLGSFDYQRYLGIDSIKIGDGNLLFAGEVGAYNGPWTLPGDVVKLNTVVRYSQGSDVNGFSLTGMAYGNHWNSTDQVPERAIPDIGLYGYLDPYDGGNTQRFSLSGQWAMKDGDNAWHVNAFAVRSALNLWNDFTYYLENPYPIGDQFHQHETRTFGGVYASYTLTKNIAGVPTENEIGVQTRFDAINLLLDNTYERGFLSPIRQDIVDEGSIGVYAQQTAHWSDWFKTVIGIRGDFYAASDDQIVPVATQALNSGKPTAFVPGPKASIIFGPFDKTEFYMSIGQGFHSNDVRAVTVQVEPTEPDQRLNPGTFLVPTQGAEIGARTKIIDGLNSSVAVFGLDAASENIFDGDAGDTQPTLLPTRRIGIEWTNDYHPVSWLSLDVDFADTRARFLGYDYNQQATYVSLWGYPEAWVGNAPGNYVPGAATVVGSLKLTVGEATGWFGGLEYRYFGKRPLTEDGAFWSPATGLLNARVGYRFDNGWALQLDGLNVTDSKSDQITYAYGSLLPTDQLYAACYGPVATRPPVAVCQNGVMDRVFKPVEPLQLRLSLVGKFGSPPSVMDDLSAPPPPAPVFTWTGMYVGGQLGYAFGSGSLDYDGFDPFDGVYFNTGNSNEFHGVIGGAHFGYNFEINNQLVVGLEGSIDGTGLSNSVTDNLSAFGGGTLLASANASVQGSVRGRAGLAWDRALIYATAGVAFTTVHTNYSLTANFNGDPLIAGGAVFNTSTIFSNSRTGWTVGGGADYAVNDNWSVFAEYRYTDFGTISNPGLTTQGFIGAPVLTNGALLNVNRTLNQSQVELGFSYKFGNNAAVPIAAKY